MLNLFKRKPTKNDNNLGIDYFGNKVQKPIDPSIDKVFRIGAILIVLYILYSTYESGNKPVVNSIKTAEKIYGEDDPITPTDEQIEQKVSDAFAKMKESDEFKKVSEFVNLIEDKSGSGKIEVITIKKGNIIFVPKKLSETKNFTKNTSKISSNEFDFELKATKKPQGKISKIKKTQKSTADSAKKAQ